MNMAMTFEIDQCETGTSFPIFQGASILEPISPSEDFRSKNAMVPCSFETFKQLSSLVSQVPWDSWPSVSVRPESG